MGIVLTLVSLFMFIGSPEFEAEPMDRPKCNTEQLAILIRLDIPDEKIAELCKEK